MLDREFGKYRLIERLGRGGMADVYLATDTESGAEVALKVVEMRGDRDSCEICEAERRGALLQEEFGRVDSHVPKVHGYGTHEGYFYIDMEYVEGEDLAERIGRAPLPFDQAAWVASEICDFLQKAHEFEATLGDRKIRGIIHGDIKPKNVRLNKDGQVKILDFGIAKGLALSRKLTRNDFGSLSYLSPERLDTGEVDVHVDFWSVGVLLYEMVTGVPPYQADSSPALESLIRSRQPPAPLPDTCPPALARVILKMLAGSPARRYADAALIRHDLQACLRGEPTTADAEWMAAQPVGDETRRTAADDAVAPSGAVVPPPLPGPVGLSDENGAAVGGDASEATRRTLQTAEVLAAGAVAGAGGVDAEATRRTIQSGGIGTADLQAVTGDDSEATRRTVAAGAPAIVPPPLPVGAAIAAPASRQPARRPMGRWVAVVLFLTTIGLVVNEVSVWTAARRIRVELATGQSAEIQGLWDEYRGLTRRSLLGIGLVGVRGPLRDRLMSQADRIIADYRQDAPTVREAQWRQGATWLTDAPTLSPVHHHPSPRLRYCEGHIRRIEGEARKRRKLSAAPAFRDAVSKFEEAARADKRWPDPYLGLARTYVYGLDDLDKAIASLDEAEHRGYRPGNRELVQLADGYRSRAERWRREAGAVHGLDQEHDCLQKAADDYRRSLELYQKAIGFGEASSAVRTIQARLDEVEKMLAE